MIPIRQPLQTVFVEKKLLPGFSFDPFPEGYLKLIKDELNVKEVVFVDKVPHRYLQV